MDAYNTINDILVHLFNEIWELEKKAIITEEFKDITNTDCFYYMHIVDRNIRKFVCYQTSALYLCQILEQTHQ